MAKVRLTEEDFAAPALVNEHRLGVTTDGLLKIREGPAGAYRVIEGAGNDTTALHDDTAGEIAAIGLKGTPVAADILVIEDSADSNNKKRITVGSLPGGSEINALVADGISGIADDQLAVGTGAGTAAYQTLPNGAISYNTTTGVFAQAAAADLTDGVPNTRTLDINGDANEIVVDLAGPLDLSANRAWSIGLADNPTIPGTYVTVPVKADPDPSGVDGRLYYNSTSNVLKYAEDATWRTIIYAGGAFHNGFSDYLAAEHVDWAAASAGTIHTDNYIEGGPGTDTTAIHDDTSGEINAIATKGSPVGADVLVIEDSAASFAKKKITISTLPAGGEINDLAGDGISGIADNQLAVGTGAGTAGYQTLPTGAISFNGTVFAQAAAADLTDGVPDARTLDINGDANEIVVDLAGPLDLSANRAWSIGIADNPTIPGTYMTVPVKADPDPTGANGRLFYNSTDNRLRYAEATTWRDVVYAGGAFHNGFSDYVAAEHVDWAAAAAGTIHTDNYIEGGDGTDGTAIHDDTSGEINAIAVKGSPVGADVLVIEDSAASFAKKKITISTLPAGGEINDLAGDGISGIADNQLAVGTGAGTAGYQTLPTGAVSFNGTVFAQAAAADLTDGIPSARTLDINGDANEIVVDLAGPLDLTANRAWSVGIADNPTIPGTYMTVPVKADPDPTGVDGRLYYNSTANDLKYAQDATWRTVVNTAEAQTLSSKTLADAICTLGLRLPVDVATGTNGEVTVDNTNGQLRYMGASATQVLMPFRMCGISFKEPATADENIMYVVPFAITIQEVIAIGRGGTSVAWQLRFDATDADNVGTLIEGNTTTTNGTVDSHTVLDDATIPAGSIIWAELDTVTGSVADFTIQFRYTVNAT
jgi:hypothetical protein